MSADNHGRLLRQGAIFCGLDESLGGANVSRATKRRRIEEVVARADRDATGWLGAEDLASLAGHLIPGLGSDAVEYFQAMLLAGARGASDELPRRQLIDELLPCRCAERTLLWGNPGFLPSDRVGQSAGYGRQQEVLGSTLASPREGMTASSIGRSSPLHGSADLDRNGNAGIPGSAAAGSQFGLDALNRLHGRMDHVALRIDRGAEVPASPLDGGGSTDMPTRQDTEAALELLLAFVTTEGDRKKGPFSLEAFLTAKPRQVATASASAAAAAGPLVGAAVPHLRSLAVLALLRRLLPGISPLETRLVIAAAHLGRTLEDAAVASGGGAFAGEGSLGKKVDDDFGQEGGRGDGRGPLLASASEPFLGPSAGFMVRNIVKASDPAIMSPRRESWSAVLDDERTPPCSPTSPGVWSPRGSPWQREQGDAFRWMLRGLASSAYQRLTPRDAQKMIDEEAAGDARAQRSEALRRRRRRKLEEARGMKLANATQGLAVSDESHEPWWRLGERVALRVLSRLLAPVTDPAGHDVPQNGRASLFHDRSAVLSHPLRPRPVHATLVHLVAVLLARGDTSGDREWMEMGATAHDGSHPGSEPFTAGEFGAALGHLAAAALILAEPWLASPASNPAGRHRGAHKAPHSQLANGSQHGGASQGPSVNASRSPAGSRTGGPIHDAGSANGSIKHNTGTKHSASASSPQHAIVAAAKRALFARLETLARVIGEDPGAAWAAFHALDVMDAGALGREESRYKGKHAGAHRAGEDDGDNDGPPLRISYPEFLQLAMLADTGPDGSFSPGTDQRSMEAEGSQDRISLGGRGLSKGGALTAYRSRSPSRGGRNTSPLKGPRLPASPTNSARPTSPVKDGRPGSPRGSPRAFVAFGRRVHEAQDSPTAAAGYGFPQPAAAPIAHHASQATAAGDGSSGRREAYGQGQESARARAKEGRAMRQLFSPRSSLEAPAVSASPVGLRGGPSVALGSPHQRPFASWHERMQRRAEEELRSTKDVPVGIASQGNNSNFTMDARRSGGSSGDATLATSGGAGFFTQPHGVGMRASLPDRLSLHQGTGAPMGHSLHASMAGDMFSEAGDGGARRASWQGGDWAPGRDGDAGGRGFAKGVGGELPREVEAGLFAFGEALAGYLTRNRIRLVDLFYQIDKPHVGRLPPEGVLALVRLVFPRDSPQAAPAGDALLAYLMSAGAPGWAGQGMPLPGGTGQDRATAGGVPFQGSSASITFQELALAVQEIKRRALALLNGDDHDVIARGVGASSSAGAGKAKARAGRAGMEAMRADRLMSGGMSADDEGRTRAGKTPSAPPGRPRQGASSPAPRGRASKDDPLGGGDDSGEGIRDSLGIAHPAGSRKPAWAHVGGSPADTGINARTATPQQNVQGERRRGEANEGDVQSGLCGQLASIIKSRHEWALGMFRDMDVTGDGMLSHADLLAFARRVLGAEAGTLSPGEVSQLDKLLAALHTAAGKRPGEGLSFKELRDGAVRHLLPTSVG
eukprot:jgi/Mesvir1/2118/Mv16646-RA.1